MTYTDTIKQLFALLEVANASDSFNALHWQETNDSSQKGYFGHIYEAIRAIAGSEILENYCNCGEVDLEFANRKSIKITMEMCTPENCDAALDHLGLPNEGRHIPQPQHEMTIGMKGNNPITAGEAITLLIDPWSSEYHKEACEELLREAGFLAPLSQADGCDEDLNDGRTHMEVPL